MATFIEKVSPKRANMGKVLQETWAPTKEEQQACEEHSCMFQDWVGNPLPTLPTVEMTWEGRYILFLAESQLEEFLSLKGSDLIFEGEEGYIYPETTGLKKMDLDGVSVYADLA